jgi:hypothetical protein
MVSVRAVATAATCRPRFARIRWKKARRGPGAFDAAQAASTSIARAGERPRGIQPDGAHELLRRPHARDVADGGAESDRDDRIDAGDGQEVRDGGVGDDRFTEQTIDRLQLLAKSIEFAEALLDPTPFFQR